jgi:hypothetical protein
VVVLVVADGTEELPVEVVDLSDPQAGSASRAVVATPMRRSLRMSAA